MSYEPKEGVDYLIDLYEVAGANPEDSPGALNKALNQRLVEYHPDRLQGLAPEFQSKGEKMARLLNRAKVILLDAERRQDYDEILAEWEGPVSADGTPILTMERHLQSEMEDKTPDEIEGIFAEQRERIESMTGYTPSRLSFLENMVAQAGDEVPVDLRTEYEDALLSYDRTLAIQEAERSRLLSLPEISKDGYRAGLNYSEVIAVEIETARDVRKEQLHTEALGGVGTRLALLAGEEVDSTSTATALASSIELPSYFIQQAIKVRELAVMRQELVEKRLVNFRPEYPLAEVQTEARQELIVGVGKDVFQWFCSSFDQDTHTVNIDSVHEELAALLNKGSYQEVIESGYNILTFSPLDQIDIQTQLIDAIEKHVYKFETDMDEQKNI